MPATPNTKPRLLLDTNVVIAHENDGPTPQTHADAAAELVELAHDMGFELLLSNGTRQDFLNAPEPLRSQRTKVVKKYYRTLEAVPAKPAVREQFPDTLKPNDAADVEVLSTFATGMATVLVTEDVAMKKRAERAGLTRVLTINAALDWLRELGAPTLDNASAANMVGPYLVGLHAPIFDTLRADYPGFDRWWTGTVVATERDTIVLGDPAEPDGIAVLKPEQNPYGLGDPVLKICTFKVMDRSDAGAGRRGELLLRAVVDYARETKHTVMYLTAHPHHDELLLPWLEKFGFHHHDDDDGELVLVKWLEPSPDAPVLDPLEHAIEYGPQSVRILDAYMVPIKHVYHDRLLPDSSPQVSLFENEPCGNAIRKAYLCHANIRRLKPGDLLTFLRTNSPKEIARVTAVGVVEDTFVSDDPVEVAAAVRGRTVYSYAEIEEMCAKRPVLVILFRLDRRVDPPWSVGTLNQAQLMTRSPQSIATIKKSEGVEWLRTVLDASP